MDSKSKYTGVIVLTDPVYITDSKGNTIFIYGILYDMLRKMKDDLFSWGCQRYLAYLYGAQRCQYNKGIVEPDVWITSYGGMIVLDNPVKNAIYKIMREDIPVYTLVEFLEPLELEENEYEDCFLISKAPLKRYGVIKDDNSEKGKEKNFNDREPLTKYLIPFESYNQMDEECDGDEILVATPFPLPPMEITVSESQEKFLKGVLLNENFKKDLTGSTGDTTHTNESVRGTGYVKKLSLDHPDRTIKSFESFIGENKGQPSNVQSYFGCLDDDDDPEEEE